MNLGSLRENRTEEIRAMLNRLAAEMDVCKGMPSEFADDWDFYKSTPKTEIRKIINASIKANKQSHIWAGKIKYIADLL